MSSSRLPRHLRGAKTEPNQNDVTIRTKQTKKQSNHKPNNQKKQRTSSVSKRKRSTLDKYLQKNSIAKSKVNKNLVRIKNRGFRTRNHWHRCYNSCGIARTFNRNNTGHTIDNKRSLSALHKRRIETMSLQGLSYKFQKKIKENKNFKKSKYKENYPVQKATLLNEKCHPFASQKKKNVKEIFVVDLPQGTCLRQIFQFLCTQRM